MLTCFHMWPIGVWIAVVLGAHGNVYKHAATWRNMDNRMNHKGTYRNISEQSTDESAILPMAASFPHTFRAIMATSGQYGWCPLRHWWPSSLLLCGLWNMCPTITLGSATSSSDTSVGLKGVRLPPSQAPLLIFRRCSNPNSNRSA